MHDADVYRIYENAEKGTVMGMKCKLKKACVYIGLILLIFLIDLPVINMVGVSLKSSKEIMTNNSLFPKNPTLENFIGVIEKSNFLLYLKNSFVVAVVVTLLTAVVASLAGYALSRFVRKYRILGLYSNFLLIVQMFPTILMLIPLFVIFKNVGLSNSRWSIILLYMTFSLPFCTWMMSGFFDGVPIEMDEAGRVDGCSRLQTFTRMVLPVSGPGVAAVSIFTFIYCWNEYTLASVFMKSEELKTLPVGVQVFTQQFSKEWGLLMAASVLAIIPVTFFLIFMQKYLIEGMTAGAVKG